MPRKSNKRSSNYEKFDSYYTPPTYRFINRYPLRHIPVRLSRRTRTIYTPIYDYSLDERPIRTTRTVLRPSITKRSVKNALLGGLTNRSPFVREAKYVRYLQRKLKCMNATDERRRQYFKAKNTGGSTNLNKRRKHKKCL